MERLGAQDPRDGADCRYGSGRRHDHPPVTVDPDADVLARINAVVRALCRDHTNEHRTDMRHRILHPGQGAAGDRSNARFLSRVVGETAVEEVGADRQHGEMSALHAAGRQKSYRDTTLYTTLAPCAMCAGTIVQFKIPRVGWVKHAPSTANWNSCAHAELRWWSWMISVPST